MNGVRWSPDNYPDANEKTRTAMLNEPATVYSWWCNEPSPDAIAYGSVGTLCTGNGWNLCSKKNIEGAARNGMVCFAFISYLLNMFL